MIKAEREALDEAKDEHLALAAECADLNMKRADLVVQVLNMDIHVKMLDQMSNSECLEKDPCKRNLHYARICGWREKQMEEIAELATNRTK